MHYSVRIDVNIKEIVSSVLDLVKTECCQYGKLTGIDDIEENLLNGIENASAENVNIFFLLDTSCIIKSEFGIPKKREMISFPLNTAQASNRKMLLLAVFHNLPEKYPFMNYLLRTLTFFWFFASKNITKTMSILRFTLQLDYN